MNKTKVFAAQQAKQDSELFLGAFHNASEKTSKLDASLVAQLLIAALMTGIHIGNTEEKENKKNG